MEYIVNLDNVNNRLFSVVGALRIKNRCCEDKSVIITKTLDKNIYSCQCECGGWCSSGFNSIGNAIFAWERMNSRGKEDGNL